MSTRTPAVVQAQIDTFQRDHPNWADNDAHVALITAWTNERIALLGKLNSLYNLSIFFNLITFITFVYVSIISLIKYV